MDVLSASMAQLKFGRIYRAPYAWGNRRGSPVSRCRTGHPPRSVPAPGPTNRLFDVHPPARRAILAPTLGSDGVTGGSFDGRAGSVGVPATGHLVSHRAAQVWRDLGQGSRLAAWELAAPLRSLTST